MSNPTATESPASFTRGLFARAIYDELVFPFPAPLDERSPDEAKVIRRLTRDIAEMTAAGLIDAERSDAEETIHEETIRAFAERGLLDQREARGGAPTAYVCRNYTCDEPVTDPRALGEQLDRVSRRAER